MQPKTPDAVRRMTLNDIRVQMLRYPWLKKEDREVITRMMTEILPRFAATLQDEGIRRTPAGSVRAAGVMTLSNMLALLGDKIHEEGATAEEQRLNISEQIVSIHQMVLNNLTDGAVAMEHVEGGMTAVAAQEVLRTAMLKVAMGLKTKDALFFSCVVFASVAAVLAQTPKRELLDDEVWVNEYVGHAQAVFGKMLVESIAERRTGSKDGAAA